MLPPIGATVYYVIIGAITSQRSHGELPSIGAIGAITSHGSYSQLPPIGATVCYLPYEPLPLIGAVRTTGVTSTGETLGDPLGTLSGPTHIEIGLPSER